MRYTLPAAWRLSSSLRQQVSNTTCALMLTLSAPPTWKLRGALTCSAAACSRLRAGHQVVLNRPDCMSACTLLTQGRRLSCCAVQGLGARCSHPRRCGGSFRGHRHAATSEQNAHKATTPPTSSIRLPAGPAWLIQPHAAALLRPAAVASAPPALPLTLVQG
jgi:hypothetical protein